MVIFCVNTSCTTGPTVMHFGDVDILHVVSEKPFKLERLLTCVASGVSNHRVNRRFVDAELHAGVKLCPTLRTLMGPDIQVNRVKVLFQILWDLKGPAAFSTPK